MSSPIKPVQPAPIKKTVKAPKPTPAHPAYFDMIAEAAEAMKKHGKGATRPSIVHYIENKYSKVLGANWKIALKLALKRQTLAGKLIKTKDSFKVAKAAIDKKKPKKLAKKVKKAKKPKRARNVKKSKTVKKNVKSNKKAAKKVKKPTKKTTTSKAKKNTKAKKPAPKKAAKKSVKKATRK
eukprot:NODE_4854_length_731_cov_4372.024834_g4692_i0.p1 GENE.NODE_4854_length_731_cov_4372.024834_g4692_i0~~NODE_4854_length_731_cov_4372.024834_g4692_i0.p1  ORF type:complete len:181 (-),score=53.71 NODE_4854_length_731_cov_4372.024834_g4692_i0:115-657(-)